MPVYVNGELVLYGFCGYDDGEDGFTAFGVLSALAQHGWSNDLTVRINSGGGYIDDGISIYNSLKAHKGKVTVIVDAMAGSAASVIAMAGDEIIMRQGALMMIHEPATWTSGTLADHEASAASLRLQLHLVAEIYADRTGQSVEDVKAAMAKTTWMDGAEAVAAGYATRTEERPAAEITAFDYRVYANAPARLVALAEDRGWSIEQIRASGSQAPALQKPATQETTTMPNEQTAAGAGDAPAAPDAAAIAAEATARIQAILTCDEAKGRGQMAQHLAFHTKMGADEAKALLAVAPDASEESPGPSGNYDQRRTTARAQAQPGGGGSKPAATINAGDIYARRATAMKG